MDIIKIDDIGNHIHVTKIKITVGSNICLMLLTFFQFYFKLRCRLRSLIIYLVCRRRSQTDFKGKGEEKFVNVAVGHGNLK